MNENHKMDIKMAIITWLGLSNRWKHLLGGFVIGIGADDLYCAAYAGIGVAAALELKDHLWGGKADIPDFIITITGVALGFGLKSLF